MTTLTQVLIELEKSCDKILNVKFENNGRLHDAIIEAIKPVCDRYKINPTTWAVNIGPEVEEDATYWDIKVAEYFKSEMWHDARSKCNGAAKLTKAVFSVPETMNGIDGNTDFDTYLTMLKIKEVEKLQQAEDKHIRELKLSLSLAWKTAGELKDQHIKLFNSLS